MQIKTVKGLTTNFQNYFFYKFIQLECNFCFLRYFKNSYNLIPFYLVKTFSQQHSHQQKHTSIQNASSRILCGSSNDFCFIFSIVPALRETWDMKKSVIITNVNYKYVGRANISIERVFPFCRMIRVNKNFVGAYRFYVQRATLEYRIIIQSDAGRQLPN